ncbi:MAG: hypothetical protein SFU98_13180 [Leptospiraceae bacterium]|nr:hypothetical protein [Leptospiraceae bacterium]
MAIDKKELLRRLAFIKYLYQIGIEQSYKPEPLCNAAMLSFHDSMELFMYMACEHHNAQPAQKNAGLLDYFKALENTIDLTQKVSIERFNKTRVAIKHSGVMASRIDIESFRSVCVNFFEDNTLIAFDIDFHSISLINLITFNKPKQHLEIAEKHIDSNNYKDAISEITLAFWLLIQEYEESKRHFYGKSPFFFGKSMTFLNSFHMNIEDRKLGEFIDNVNESISSMQSSMKILSLGFDYRKFTKFDLITPRYVKTFGGDNIYENPKANYKLDDAKWCFDYVIECCLILQDFDYKVV